MTHRYRLTEQAESDVIDIWAYVAADSIDAADRLTDRFTETYQRLTATPGMGSKQEQYRPDLRAFPIGNYIIDDGIEVYRVLHGARDLKELL